MIDRYLDGEISPENRWREDYILAGDFLSPPGEDEPETAAP
jgi:hypothetical protein